MLVRRMDQGDTIIELVIAFAIFSMAALGTVAIVNSGVATTQRNLEITQVRQQIDSQAETIRYLHDSSSPTWQTIIGAANILGVSDTPMPLNSEGATCPSPGLKAFFVIQPSAGAAFQIQRPPAGYSGSPATYARVGYPGVTSDSSIPNGQSYGVWIQTVKAQDVSAGVDAYDFYIHACWFSVGTQMPMVLGTIVRVYGG